MVGPLFHEDQSWSIKLIVPGMVNPAATTSGPTPSKSAAVIIVSVTSPIGFPSPPTMWFAGIPGPAISVQTRQLFSSLWSYESHWFSSNVLFGSKFRPHSGVANNVVCPAISGMSF